MITPEKPNVPEQNFLVTEQNHLEQENLAAMDKMRVFFKGLKIFLQNSNIEKESLDDFIEGITILETTYEKRLNNWKTALHHQKLHFQQELERQPAKLEHKELNLQEKIKQLEEKSAGQKEHIKQLTKNLTELKQKVNQLKTEITVKEEAASTAEGVAKAYKRYEQLYFELKAKFENSASKTPLTSFWKKKN